MYSTIQKLHTKFHFNWVDALVTVQMNKHEWNALKWTSVLLSVIIIIVITHITVSNQLKARTKALLLPCNSHLCSESNWFDEHVVAWLATYRCFFLSSCSFQNHSLSVFTEIHFLLSSIHFICVGGSKKYNTSPLFFSGQGFFFVDGETTL